ncbi:MAG: hypothetical protein K2P08_05020 [Oscillospiraceae bacterium]|nr:hypothetical protein [Oscillospiraceae bacterium]
MRYTEKLKLKLPEPSDPAKIEDISENFEKLDDLGAGVEAVKNGTGPGSLFLVSRHYKEPIKDALVCNGGAVDGDTHQELRDVLQLKYGGSIKYDLRNSLYQITGTYPYPVAYHKKRDMYVGVDPDNKFLVFYRRGQSPQRVFDTTVQEAGAIGAITTVFCFDNVIYGLGSSIKSAWRFAYDLSAGAFKKANESGVNSDLYSAISVATSYNSVIKYAETANYYLCASGTYNIGVHDKETKTYRTATLRVLSGDTVVASSLSIAGFISDAKGPGSRIYFLCYPRNNPTPYYLAYFDESDFEGSESVSTWDAHLAWSTEPDNVTDFRCGTRYGNYFYWISSRVSGTPPTITLYRCNLSGSIGRVTLGTWTSQSIPRLPIASITSLQGDSNTIVLSNVVARNSDGTGKSDGFLLAVDLSMRTIRKLSTAYNPESALPISDELIATDKGLIENVRINTFKLPSISVSESLVYMRTKGT